MPEPKVTIDGDTMVITIDVSKQAYDTAEKTKTGKTRMIASTGGFLSLETPGGPAKLSLNLIRPL